MPMHTIKTGSQTNSSGLDWTNPAVRRHEKFPLTPGAVFPGAAVALRTGCAWFRRWRQRNCLMLTRVLNWAGLQPFPDVADQAKLGKRLYACELLCTRVAQIKPTSLV